MGPVCVVPVRGSVYIYPGGRGREGEKGRQGEKGGKKRVVYV